MITLRCLNRANLPSKIQPISKKNRFYKIPEVIYRCSNCDNIPVCSSTRHCWICKACIVQFDHHCDWIGICVGGKNYKKFLIFLGSGSVLQLLQIVLKGVIIFFVDVELFLMLDLAVLSGSDSFYGFPIYRILRNFQCFGFSWLPLYSWSYYSRIPDQRVKEVEQPGYRFLEIEKQK